MKRLLILTMTISFLLTTTGVEVTQATPRHQPACTGRLVRWLRPQLGVAVVESRVKTLLIPCLWRHRHPPVPLSTGLCIANRESHYYPAALNPSGSAGVWQIINWASRARFYLHKRDFPGSPFTPPWSFVISARGWADARANTLVAIAMMKANGLSDWGGRC
jgi:hypothetical protein